MMRSTYGSLGAALLTGSLSMGVAGTALGQEAGKAEEAEKAAEEAKSWADQITIGAFVDAYAALRSDNNEGRLAAFGGPTLPLSDYPHSAYVSADGFGLAFAGADVVYSGDKFGATMSLRFGPGVTRFYGGDVGILGIENITQAYVTWKPFENLTFDMGMFGTIYGAEVAESWRNLNYSRGALYFLMQPFWHTGLRANYQLNDFIGFNAMIVNGVNNVFEDNKSPSLGAQVLITPIDELFVSVGYLGALTPRDGGEGLFHNFFDVVATLNLGNFTLVGNFDYNLYDRAGPVGKENWWGLSVAPGYAFTNWFGAAARVEYLSDSANALFGMATPPGDSAWLTTFTATLDFKPIPNSGALVLRPEFRYELARDDYFLNKDNDPSEKFWTIMLGAVVTSM